MYSASLMRDSLFLRAVSHPTLQAARTLFCCKSNLKWFLELDVRGQVPKAASKSPSSCFPVRSIIGRCDVSTLVRDQESWFAFGSLANGNRRQPDEIINEKVCCQGMLT